MSDYVTQIEDYLDYLFTYGPVWVYLLIFAACFIENIVPPFPGDSFIVAAGGLVAASRLDLVWAVVSVVVGGICSVMVWYYVARRFGRGFFQRRNFRFFSAADIEAVEARFERYGGWLLVVSRFVVGMRVLLIISAGIANYSTVRMVLYSTISYLLFGGALMYLGYALVENVDRIDYYFRTYSYIAWPIVVALILFFVFRRVQNIRNRNSS
jgi:membrane protein DedA with SNARE-associated domain